MPFRHRIVAAAPALSADTIRDATRSDKTFS
jgi:hypothetical protein